MAEALACLGEAEEVTPTELLTHRGQCVQLQEVQQQALSRSIRRTTSTIGERNLDHQHHR
jgi:hypothetical protein